MINFNYTNFLTNNDSHKLAKQVSVEIAAAISANHDSYQIFRTNKARDQINDSRHIASKIKNNFTDLIIIGMGGATLNPRAVIDLSEGTITSPTRIHFLDNTDPIFFFKLISTIDLSSCAVLAISNSGQTLETNALVGAMIYEFEKNSIDLSDRFFFITKSKSGILSNIANKISAPIIEHTHNISGRFSGLTNVTTLAAAIAGVDVNAYIDGAHDAIEKFLNDPQSCQAVQTSALIFAAKKPIMVNIAYLQQFSSYLEWYSQIIAESLGKDGQGITPVSGLGPNDQHSMLQLYLDGPTDKIYSMFYVENLQKPQKICSYNELGNIGGRFLSDINTVNFQATATSLISRNVSVRTILLKSLSAKSIGSLIAHSMLEIVILAHMMKINPFNQPGVELIKTKSSELLK